MLPVPSLGEPPIPFARVMRHTARMSSTPHPVRPQEPARPAPAEAAPEAPELAADPIDALERRQFLALSVAMAAVGLSPAAIAGRPRAAGAGAASVAGAMAQPAADDADASPPPITVETIREAQKLLGLSFTDEEIEQMLAGLRGVPRQYAARRRIDLPNELAQALVFDPTLGRRPTRADTIVRPARTTAPPLPADEVDIAYAPVSTLSRWIHEGAITSERLTRLYLDRLKEHGDRLEGVVTLTEDLALRQARRADAELRRGHDRGPLHGIPYGAKDLFDTAGIRTTYGAMPYKDRVPDEDAVVIRRLRDAGGVLLGKLTLGALAYGDIWYDGRTNNPWNLEQGSSGSSAGSAACTASGLVGFSIGTETLGSIVSPSTRCGTTGLRPTFGRVPRTGAMALCWSLDKVGPICRTVEDTALVLDALSGPDPGDPSSFAMPMRYDAAQDFRGMRVGYRPEWFDGEGASEHDKRAFDAVRALGVELVEIELPEWPYGLLFNLLTVEAAAAFEEITLTNTDDQMVWQEPRAWPNSFRAQWFMPAIEYVQMDRFRRKVAEMMRGVFNEVDVIAGPSFASGLLIITNFTGHPQLVMRSGFGDDGTPRSFSLWGGLFSEGTLAAMGRRIEQALGVWNRRPPEFA